MINSLDTYLFGLLNEGMANPLLDWTMPFFTDRSYLFLLPFLVWFFFRDSRKALTATIAAVLSLTFSDWFVHVMKELTGRPRPFLVLESARVLVGRGKAFSMPSGHAASAFAVITPFVLLFGGWARLVLIGGAAGVAFSRVYVGVHYPSDVIVGAVLGAAVALLTLSLYRWSRERYRASSFGKVLLVFLSVLSIFRIYYIYTGPIDLSPLEASVWSASGGSHMGFFSRYPFTAPLVGISSMVFGDNEFGVRAPAILLSFLSSWVLFLLTRRLFDGRTALYSALLYQFVPLFSLLGLLSIPSTLFVFLWLLGVYAFVTLSSPAGKRHLLLQWIMLGVIAGLGLVLNAVMGLFLLCVLVFLFLDGNRKYYLSGPALSLLCAFLVFLPFSLWGEKTLAGNGPAMFGGTSVISGIVLSGSVTPILMIFLWVALYRMKNEEQRPLFLAFALIPLIAAVLFGFFGTMRADLFGIAHLLLLAPFSLYFLTDFRSLRKWVRMCVVAAIVVSCAVSVLAHYPHEAGLHRTFRPVSDLYGWEKVGKKVSVVMQKEIAEGRHSILTDDCGLAGELSFYIDGHPEVACDIREWRKDNAGLWQGSGDMVNYSALFITATKNSSGVRPGELFDSCEGRNVRIKAQGMYIRTLDIWECSGLKEGTGM